VNARGNIFGIGPSAAGVYPAEFAASRDDFCVVDVAAARECVRFDETHGGLLDV